MASFTEYYETLLLILLVFLVSIYLYIAFFRNYGSSVPTNWPIFGMIPGIVRNAHHIHDYATEVLKETNGTILIKGPRFANMDTLITSDPSNIHYLLSKNFPNYPKGPEFKKIFDVLGDGIFNSDAELWELHRKTTLSFFNHSQFQSLLERTIRDKVEKRLIPFLEHVSRRGIEIDLQEVFQRFTFDSICKMALDYDPESLSIDLPYMPCEKAFTAMEEALLYRHVFPESYWKLQKHLRIGKERRLDDACKAMDQFIYKCISKKEEEVISEAREIEEEFGLLTAFMRAYKEKGGTSGDTKRFLKDTLFNLMIAGRDTTSTALTWFFYLIANHPSVEAKILDEIREKLAPISGNRKPNILYGKELVYLHGALCEALRLFPPVALEHKSPTQDDILPSGHRVDTKMKIILSFYSMGRMETIWGKDCSEFKPGRWISQRGGNKHEPSFKFPAFHAGPRTCLGKDMAFTQMKMVASTVIYNYHAELVKGQTVAPSDSIILQIKHGLKVKFTKRKGEKE